MGRVRPESGADFRVECLRKRTVPRVMAVCCQSSGGGAVCHTLRGAASRSPRCCRATARRRAG